MARSAPARLQPADEQQLLRLGRLVEEIERVANLGIWTWDPREPTAWWSPPLYAIYGLDPAAHVPTYEDYLARVHPDDRARVAAATEAAVEDHVSYSHDERILRPDGTMRYLHTWAHAETDREGNLVRLFGVCQDVTDRVRAAEELARSTRQLEVTEKLSALGTLVSGVGHEIRTPLTYVGVRLAILEEQAARLASTNPEAAEEMSRNLASAVEGLQRINRIVTQLRQFAKPSPHRAPVGLDEVAREAADLFRAARRTDIDVVLDLAPTPPLDVDKVQLEQVLINLLHNAADAAPAGSRVTVRSFASGPVCVLDVHDEGPGMPPEVQARLFDPFFSTKKDGTGLGLSISRRIAEAHGGTLTFASAPGQGTTFTLRIPVAAAASPQPS